MLFTDQRARRVQSPTPCPASQQCAPSPESFTQHTRTRAFTFQKHATLVQGPGDHHVGHTHFPIPSPTFGPGFGPACRCTAHEAEARADRSGEEQPLWHHRHQESQRECKSKRSTHVFQHREQKTRPGIAPTFYFIRTGSLTMSKPWAFQPCLRIPLQMLWTPANISRQTSAGGIALQADTTLVSQARASKHNFMRASNGKESARATKTNTFRIASGTPRMNKLTRSCSKGSGASWIPVISTSLSLSTSAIVWFCQGFGKEILSSRQRLKHNPNLTHRMNDWAFLKHVFVSQVISSFAPDWKSSQNKSKLM